MSCGRSGSPTEGGLPRERATCFGSRSHPSGVGLRGGEILRGGDPVYMFRLPVNLFGAGHALC